MIVILCLLLSLLSPPAHAQPSEVMSRVNGGWIVQLPDGSLLDTTGTQTQGLQEAIDWAIQNNSCLFIYGGAQSQTDDPRIVANVTIQIPNSAKRCIHAYGVSLWLEPTTGDGIDIASGDMDDVSWSGQIVYTGSGSAIGMYVGGSYYEGSTLYAAFAAGRYDFRSIVCALPDGTAGTSGTGLSINPNNGDFMGNTISVTEIHGCATPHIIYQNGGISTPNFFSWGWVH